MAPRHAKDEQPRETWPLNEPRDTSAVAAALESRPATARHATQQAPAPQAAGAGASSGHVDFATYVNETIDREGGGKYGREPVPVDEDRRDGARPATATPDDERAAFERVGLGTVYRSDSDRHDAVLGLDYATIAPRSPVRDDGWSASLRRFARAAVWALPAAAILFALSSAVGWPTETGEPALFSPGTWVIVTALALALWMIGVMALAALAATSRGRTWGMLAVVASAFGVALLGPVVGAAGLGRPAIARAANEVRNDTNIAAAANRMQSALLDHAVGRFLLIGGSVMLAVGAVAVVGTVLGSRVLQRHDGWLIAAGVVIAIVAAAMTWSFLLTIAAMVILAGVLGLAYTASRIAPDGTPPPAY